LALSGLNLFGMIRQVYLMKGVCERCWLHASFSKTYRVLLSCFV
jgi:hypothetical protein